LLALLYNLGVLPFLFAEFLMVAVTVLVEKSDSRLVQLKPAPAIMPCGVEATSKDFTEPKLGELAFIWQLAMADSIWKRENSNEHNKIIDFNVVSVILNGS
jgi:hypothetical protein